MQSSAPSSAQRKRKAGGAGGAAGSRKRANTDTVEAAACRAIAAATKGTGIGLMVRAILADQASLTALLVEMLSTPAFVKAPIPFLEVMIAGGMPSPTGPTGASGPLLDLGLRFVGYTEALEPASVLALAKVLCSDRGVAHQVALAAANAENAAALFVALHDKLGAASSALLKCAVAGAGHALATILSSGNRAAAIAVVDEALTAETFPTRAVEMVMALDKLALFGDEAQCLIRAARGPRSAAAAAALTLITMLAKGLPVESALCGIWAWAVVNDPETHAVMCQHACLEHCQGSDGPVSVAVKAGRVKELALMAKSPFYAECMLKPIDGEPCAHILVRHGVTFEALEQCAPDPRLFDQVNGDGVSLVMAAAEARNTDALCGLIQRGGFDYAAPTATGAKTMHYIARLPYRSIDAVTALALAGEVDDIERRALLASMSHFENARLRTPLDEATARDVYVITDCETVPVYDPCVPSLLRLHAALDRHKSEAGQLVFALVKRYGDGALPLIVLAVELGYDPAQVARSSAYTGDTAAYVAARDGHARICSQLALFAGAEVVRVFTAKFGTNRTPLWYLVHNPQIPAEVLVSVHAAMRSAVAPEAAAVDAIAQRAIGLLGDATKLFDAETIDHFRRAKDGAVSSAGKIARVTRLHDFFESLAARAASAEDLAKFVYVAKLNVGHLGHLIRSGATCLAVLGHDELAGLAMAECPEKLLSHVHRATVATYVDSRVHINYPIVRYAEVEPEKAKENWAGLVERLRDLGLEHTNAMTTGMRFLGDSGFGDGVTFEALGELWQRATGSVEWYRSPSGLVPMPGTDPWLLTLIGWLLGSAYRGRSSLGTPQLSAGILALVFGVAPRRDFLLDMHSGAGFCTGGDVAGGRTLDTATALRELLMPPLAGLTDEAVASVVRVVGHELNLGNFARFLEVAADAATHWAVLGEPVAHLRAGVAAALTGNSSEGSAELVLGQIGGAFRALSSYDAISEAFCGKLSIDFAVVRSVTTFPLDDTGESYAASHPTIVRLWEILERFTPDEKREMYRFWTGCRGAPPLGLASERYSIVVGHTRQGCKRLLGAATCFKLLRVPLFDSGLGLEECIRTSMVNNVLEDRPPTP